MIDDLQRQNAVVEVDLKGNEKVATSKKTVAAVWKVNSSLSMEKAAERKLLTDIQTQELIRKSDGTELLEKVLTDEFLEPFTWTDNPIT
jgi:hypothetical protein